MGAAVSSALHLTRSDLSVGGRFTIAKLLSNERAAAIRQYWSQNSLFGTGGRRLVRQQCSVRGTQQSQLPENTFLPQCIDTEPPTGLTLAHPYEPAALCQAFASRHRTHRLRVVMSMTCKAYPDRGTHIQPAKGGERSPRGRRRVPCSI